MKKTDSPKVKVPPLNTSVEEYQKKFIETGRQEVVADVVVLVNSTLSDQEKQYLADVGLASKVAVNVLFEYDGFKKEFLPKNVKVTEIKVGFGEWALPPRLRESGKASAKKLESAVQIIVAFHKASEEITSHVAFGLISAMYWVDEEALRTRTYDPQLHTDHMMTPKDATAFRHLVGDLYRSGIGVWNEELVPFRNALTVLVRAIINGESYLDEMRRAANGGLSYVPPVI